MNENLSTDFATENEMETEMEMEMDMDTGMEMELVNQTLEKVKKGAGAQKKEMTSKTKLSLDFKEDVESFETFNKVMEEVNNKKYGRKIEPVEIVRVAITKLKAEDLHLLQESTYSKMDKVHIAHERYNEKHKASLNFEEFLLKELKLQ